MSLRRLIPGFRLIGTITYQKASFLTLFRMPSAVPDMPRPHLSDPSTCSAPSPQLQIVYECPSQGCWQCSPACSNQPCPQQQNACCCPSNSIGCSRLLLATHRHKRQSVVGQRGREREGGGGLSRFPELVKWHMAKCGTVGHLIQIL